jgi:hypothetical protein
MKDEHVGPAPRLVDQPAGADEWEVALLRALQAPPKVSPAALQRVAERIAGSEQASSRRPFLFVKLAAALTVLLVGGVVTAKYQPAPLVRLLELVAPHRVSPRPRREVAPAVVPAAPLPAPAPALPPPPQVLPSPSIAATPVAPAPARRRAVHHHHRTLALRESPARAPVVAAPAPGAPAPAAATPAPSRLAAETQLLGEALTQLRQRQDPGAALATLDDYEARFPAGALAFDALAARVDALIALGRKETALARLDAVPAGALARSPSLRAQRGELRAAMGRLPAAIADFDGVLAAAGTARAGHGADVAERALYGRGSSRARLGDAAGARQDLELYLRLYPEGRFVAEARRALGR